MNVTEKEEEIAQILRKMNRMEISLSKGIKQITQIAEEEE